MADTNFSFGFTKMPTDKQGKNFIDRPVVTVGLRHGTVAIAVPMLLDSGADHPMIPRAMAEGMGVDLTKCPMVECQSASGSFQVATCDLEVTLQQRHLRDSFTAKFQVPLNAAGYPQFPLLGREPLFRIYDVNFRLGFTNEGGKFTLHKVKHVRDAGNYQVGGRAVKDSQMRLPPRA